MATIILMEQNNIAQVVPMDEDLLTIAEPTDSEVSFEKTGQTKEILGYACQEYTVDSPDMSGSFWMTSEVEINYEGYVNAINNSFKGDKKDSFKLPEGGNGLMMEMDIMTKGKKPNKALMLVTEISEEDITFTLADYQVMNGGMMKGLGSK